MKHSRVRFIAMSLSAAALLVAGGSLVAQENLKGNAKICDDFDKNVIMGGKLDEASKYLTDDFKEHNLRLQADGLQSFVEKMKGFQAGRAGGGRGRGAAPAAAPARTVEESGDLVMFYTLNPERDDPRNPGKKLPESTHFDVYKMRGKKIAEHWD